MKKCLKNEQCCNLGLNKGQFWTCKTYSLWLQCKNKSIKDVKYCDLNPLRGNELAEFEENCLSLSLSEALKNF